jgi:hypothetical protein
MIDQLLDLLKQQPKEILQWIILELMKEGKLSFADIATTHVEYLEMLKKGETERLMVLRRKVIDLWYGTKKELPSKLVSLIQEGKDNGWVNITQEKIDNSKWNK